MPPNLAAIYGLALAVVLAVAAAHSNWTAFPLPVMAAALVVAVVVFSQGQVALVEHKVTTVVTAVLLVTREVPRQGPPELAVVRAAVADGVQRVAMALEMDSLPQSPAALVARLSTRTPAP
jgi:hypothetical protein